MGEYRFSIYTKWSFGFNISYEYGQILITVPFIRAHIALSKHASGYLIFNKYFE